MSSGRTSTVPSAPARLAWSSILLLPPRNVKPAFTAYFRTVSEPTRWRARMAGMLSDCWMASRTRTSPRYVPSRVLRRPARAERLLLVEEQGARRQPLRIDPRGVEDRLPGRARLSPGPADVVDLRRELRRLLAVVAGRADVGEDVAGAVVLHDHGAVVEVGAAETTDPAGVATQLELSELLVELHQGQVGQDSAPLDDPLADLLGPHVQRGVDLVAATTDRLPITQDRLQLRWLPRRRSAGALYRVASAGCRTIGSASAASSCSSVSDVQRPLPS